jgi:hypothetical protein
METEEQPYLQDFAFWMFLVLFFLPFLEHNKPQMSTVNT